MLKIQELTKKTWKKSRAFGANAKNTGVNKKKREKKSRAFRANGKKTGVTIKIREKKTRAFCAFKQYKKLSIIKSHVIFTYFYVITVTKSKKSHVFLTYFV